MQKLRYSILVYLQCGVCAIAINAPRLRPSPYFGSFSGMSYSSLEDLGRHDYDSFFGENNSLVYTAKAGYIDMGHLRESADRTRYLFEVCFENIRNSNTDFSFEVIEPAVYYVTLEYPDNWSQLNDDQKNRIAREVSIDMGQRFAHLSTVWHEIVTWYGYASTGLLSEKASSFSWEDSYSDLLGTKLAASVLRENTCDYNDGMTEIIGRELAKLDPQSVETAKKATETVKGKWFSGRYPFLTMKRRNFDVGFDDEFVTPFRVPGICDDAPEEPCRVPLLESLQQNGFKMRLTMTPKETERKDILKIIYRAGNGTTLQPQKDFPEIIGHIRKEAIRQSGRKVDKPVL
ncbi:MAG: DUF4056 domain-containing protein [Phycisphaerae bacterium]|nr:DUF4056 domain-containing protein [Phycisphaerae bacterium]